MQYEELGVIQRFFGVEQLGYVEQVIWTNMLKTSSAGSLRLGSSWFIRA